jgi:uncharacterized membrane protein
MIVLKYRYLVILIGFTFLACNNKKPLELKLTPEITQYAVQDKKSELYGFEIQFPEGTISPNTTLQINKAGVPDPEYETLDLSGVAVDLTLSNGQSSFDRPVTITIPLHEAPDNPVFIGYYDPEMDTWQYIPPDTVTENSIKFYSDHLSIFVPIVFDIGGLSTTFKKISYDNDLVNYAKKISEPELSQTQIESLKKKLNDIMDYTYSRMMKMNDNYEACKSRTSCTMVYEDLFKYISGEVVSTITEKILLKFIVSESGAPVIIMAYKIGAVIGSLILADCVLCFLPNSVVGNMFWLNLLKYNTALAIYKKLEEMEKGNEFSESDANKELAEELFEMIKSGEKKIVFHGMWTEPFWDVYITENEILYDFMWEKYRFYLNGEFNKYRQKQVFYNSNEEGKWIRLTIVKEPGGDGMSDRSYPYTIKLEYSEFPGILEGVGWSSALNELNTTFNFKWAE